MEDLLVRRISWGANRPSPLRCTEIFDVREDLRTAVLQSFTLPPTQIANMRGHAGVDDNVFFGGVFVNADSAEHEESPPLM